MATKKYEYLNEEELESFQDQKCPDCDCDLMKGPEGSGSINYKCFNEGCQSRFNDMGPFGVERMSDPSPGPPAPRPPPEIPYPIDPNNLHDTNELRKVLNEAIGVGYTAVQSLQDYKILPVLVGVLSSFEARIKNLEDRMSHE